jgi:outer membrane protein TolC
VRFVEDELLPQTERSAALARRAYELGDTTILVLLDNERAVLLARQNGIDARLEAARAQVDLERSLGAPLDAVHAGPTAPSDAGANR